MARQGQSGVTDTNAGIPVAIPPVAGTPPAGTTPPAGSGEDKPDTVAPPAPPAKEGRKRVKCEALKGGKIIIGKGEAVRIDENGFFEVDEEEAARLLTIPGYKEA
jgi:hypothetical protein